MGSNSTEDNCVFTHLLISTDSSLECMSSISIIYFFYLPQVKARVFSGSTNKFLSPRLSFLCASGIPFLIPGFRPGSPIPFFRRVTFNFRSLSFRAPTSRRVVRLTMQLAASIQTLHLVHYEYRDLASELARCMTIFKM